VNQIYSNVPVYTNSSINNGPRPGVGLSPAELTNSSNVRQSAWVTYIQSYTGSNLKTTNYVRANKVLFEGTTVIGVEIVEVNGTNFANSSTCNVYAPIVVASGGVFGTPQLLQLSGIGPASVLEPLGIPVVVNSPNVGNNFNDQFGILFLLTGNNIETPYRVSGLVFWNVDDETDLVNPVNTQINLETGLGYAYALPYVVYAEAIGTVFVQSTNADIYPAFDSNYLQTPHDKYVLATALEQTLQWASILNLTVIEDPCNATNCQDKYSTLYTYVNAGYGLPGNHWSGTAGLGRAVNPLTMGVYGTTGLYVLDASVMVRSPGCHTQQTVYAVAERGIELILANIDDWEWEWK